MIPTLSVIIPTHKRANILARTLEHLREQTVADQIEVIVVSDGHDDETDELCKKIINDKSLRNFQSFEVPKSHQGVARNRGVEKAQGKYVLFIGDDIFLAPHACEKHLQCHGERRRTMALLEQSSLVGVYPERSRGARDDNCAVLGFVTWDPALGITPVMHWLEKSGWQFGYPFLRPFAHQPIPPSLQHRFTYTSHISLPTEIAKKFPFREDVRLYGWEDVEWGWRLKNAGVKLFYEPDARALHHHHMTLSESLRRMETLGKSAVVMERIAPELKLVPRGWKLMKYRITALLPGMRGRHAMAFLKGANYYLTK